MRPARDVWPNIAETSHGLRYGPVDYEALVGSCDVIVLEYTGTGGYEGTTYALVSRDGRYAIASWYYGSCDHCDDLEGTRTIADLEELRGTFASMLDALPWRVTIAECITDIDAIPDSRWDTPTRGDFIARVRTLAVKP